MAYYLDDPEKVLSPEEQKAAELTYLIQEFEKHLGGLSHLGRTELTLDNCPYHLGFFRANNFWGIQITFDDRISWYPLLEQKLTTRIAAVKHFPALKKQLLEDKEVLDTCLDHAISELKELLNANGEKT